MNIGYVMFSSDMWAVPSLCVQLRPQGCYIDDADPETVLHMDFANKYLGGGIVQSFQANTAHGL